MNNTKDIKKDDIYEYQSIAETQSAQIKVIQKIIHKNKQGEIIRIRVEVSRDVIECRNPFRIDSIELK